MKAAHLPRTITDDETLDKPMRRRSIRPATRAPFLDRTGVAYLILIGVSMIPSPNWGIIILLVAVLCAADLMKSLSERPAMLEIAAAISTLQLLVGPWLMYLAFNYDVRYRMYVTDDIYFGYAVPACLALFIGLRMNIMPNSANPKIPEVQSDTFRLGVAFVLVGTAAGIVSRFLPYQAGFIVYLISNLRYIGALYAYQSRSLWKWYVIAFAIMGLYLTAAKYGVFHELLLWGTLGVNYYFIGKKNTFATKIGLLFLLVPLVFILQAVKPIYRASADRGENTPLYKVLYQVTSQPDKMFSEEAKWRVVVRTNQGWIVSAAMYWVPRSIAYANGETIGQAAYASLVPRVFSSNKLTASARKNVNKYTHLNLGENTAMGLGPLGECYINFGAAGGAVAMFVFGLFMNLIYRYVSRLTYRDAFFFNCLPLVFLQAVKCETDFVTVLNHLSKASLLVLIIYFVVIYRRKRVVSQPI